MAIIYSLDLRCMKLATASIKSSDSNRLYNSSSSRSHDFFKLSASNLDINFLVTQIDSLGKFECSRSCGHKIEFNSDFL